MKSKYKAIVFDLGNVVINVDAQPACDYWSDKFNIPSQEIKSKFPFDEVYAKFEKGLIDAARFRDHLRQHYGVNFSNEDFDRGWNLILRSLTANIEDLLNTLKKDFRLVVLSNTNEIHIPVFEKRYEKLLKNFEHKFYSSRIHTRKPEIEAYTKILNYFEYKPGEIIFLDDKYENVRQAKKMGFYPILVKSTRQLKKELKELKIL